MRFRRRRSFFDDFIEDLFEDMARSFEDVFRIGFYGVGPRRKGYVEEEREYREPISEVWETDDEVIAVIELPGVEKEDIDLRVTSRTLEVKAERKEETKEEKDKARFEERAYKGYYITLSLPTDVNPDEVKATYKNGVLEVRIKKAHKEEKKKVKIE